jgi:hypothetical protein
MIIMGRRQKGLTVIRASPEFRRKRQIREALTGLQRRGCTSRVNEWLIPIGADAHAWALSRRAMKMMRCVPVSKP